MVCASSSWGWLDTGRWLVDEPPDRGVEMAESAAFVGETRMTIDGELVEARSGRRFQNVNPATEEVLGDVADADAQDMQRAIAAAAAGVRRHRLVDQSLAPQAMPAATARRTRGRERSHARRADRRGGHAADDDLQRPARCPALRCAARARRAHRHLRMGAFARRLRRHGHAEPSPSVEGGDGRGRRDRAVELPVRGDDQQDRADPGHREHHDSETCAGHPVERHPTRTSDRRADRHPGRGRERGDLIGPSRRRGAHSLTDGRHDLVHRLDRDRQADHGAGRGIVEAGVPRTGRQVGHDRAATTPTSHRWSPQACSCASTADRDARCRPGCSSPARATTRALPSSVRRWRTCRTATRRAWT